MFGFKRRFNTEEHLSGAANTVKEKLSSSAPSVGYRTMWHNLSHNKGISAPRDLIMLTMRNLDPEGALLHRANRLKRRNCRSDGPNYLWHADGYDKLKPFGFPIHGCIDGYSCKILWLRVLKSNNNPATMASVYLDTINELDIFPKCVRTDCGS